MVRSFGVLLLIFATSVNGIEEKSWIEIVSGFGQQSIRAPGTVTVITAEEIEKMGAISLEQVLQDA